MLQKALSFFQDSVTRPSGLHIELATFQFSTKRKVGLLRLTGVFEIEANYVLL